MSSSKMMPDIQNVARTVLVKWRPLVPIVWHGPYGHIIRSRVSPPPKTCPKRKRGRTQNGFSQNGECCLFGRCSCVNRWMLFVWVCWLVLSKVNTAMDCNMKMHILARVVVPWITNGGRTHGSRKMGCDDLDEFEETCAWNETWPGSSKWPFWVF